MVDADLREFSCYVAVDVDVEAFHVTVYRYPRRMPKAPRRLRFFVDASTRYKSETPCAATSGIGPPRVIGIGLYSQVHRVDIFGYCCGSSVIERHFCCDIANPKFAT